MSASDRTKLALAETLKEMAETTPMSRIRVVELCRRSGMDRRTFYYHFRDVYDLVAWIFDQNVRNSLEHYGQLCAASMTQVLTGVRREQSFYRRALSEDSQNALGRHILEATIRLYERELQRHRGGEALGPEERFAITYHCYASVGMIRRWLFSDRDLAPAEFAVMLVQTMPPVLRCIYEPQDPQKRGEEDHEG